MGLFSHDEDSCCFDCKYHQIYEEIKKLFFDDIIDRKVEMIRETKNVLLQNAIDLSCENNLLRKQIEELKNENNKLRAKN